MDRLVGPAGRKEGQTESKSNVSYSVPDLIHIRHQVGP